MRRVVELALCLGLGAACSSGPDIQTDYDPASAAKIQNYHTYSWMPAPEGYKAPVSPIVLNRIGSAVDQTLAAKGFEKRTSGATDFKLGWHVTTKEMTDYQTVNNTYGYGGYGWGRWGGMGMGGMTTGVSNTTQRNWTQGTFILDVVDGPSNNLVWRSVVQGEVKPDKTPQENAEHIDGVVQKMFADFPPKAGS
jgi:Domain of unknown function (DUF4136)